MQTTELKAMIIEKIHMIDDHHLLMETTRLINIEIPIEEKEFVFSNSQATKVKNALHQIENGEFLTAEEANKEIDEWLKK